MCHTADAFFLSGPQGARGLQGWGETAGGLVRNPETGALLSPWILFPDTCLRTGGGGEGRDMGPAGSRPLLPSTALGNMTPAA